MFQTRYQAPLRDSGTPEKPFGFYDATVDGGWKVPHEPYTNASEKSEEQFWWWRARMLGGRTNHWGRISLRNREYDFKGKSRDGVGIDWPIGYSDVKPYYDKVESLIGVYGSNEGLKILPTLLKASFNLRPRLEPARFTPINMHRNWVYPSSPSTGQFSVSASIQRRSPSGSILTTQKPPGFFLRKWNSALLASGQHLAGVVARLRPITNQLLSTYHQPSRQAIWTSSPTLWPERSRSTLLERRLESIL